jgi:hypothetical protein
LNYCCFNPRKTREWITIPKSRIKIMEWIVWQKTVLTLSWLRSFSQDLDCVCLLKIIKERERIWCRKRILQRNAAAAVHNVPAKEMRRRRIHDGDHKIRMKNDFGINNKTQRQ